MVSLFVGTGGYGAPDPSRVIPLTLGPDGTLAETGQATVTDGANPGWVHITSDGRAYVGMEDEAGSVQAYSIDADDHSKLTKLGDPGSTSGRHPCYLAVSGKWLLASNYSSGSVAVLPINPDGSVGAPTDSKAMTGSELINPSLHDRQEMSHCHSIVPNPVHQQWVAVCDLGLSTVFIYELDHTRGALIGAHDDPRHMKLEPADGPRHAVWSSDGNRLFVNNELTCTCTVATFDPANGNLSATSCTDTLPADGSVVGTRAHHRGNSDIHLHPNGRFLYIGIRSPDPGLIGIFAIGEDGSLSAVDHVSTQGLVPRNFKLVPGEGDSVWLVCGNQETMSVVSFAVNNDTGKLTPAGSISTAPYKACNISFVPV